MPSPQQVMEKLTEQEKQVQETPPGREPVIPGFFPGTETPEPDAPVPDKTTDITAGLDPEREAPGPDKSISIITGFGVLIIILLISTMYTLAPVMTGTGQNIVIQKATTADLYDSAGSQSMPTDQATPVPSLSVTPVIISSTPVNSPPISSPTPDATPAAPRSYVTIEPVPVTTTPILQDLTQHDLPIMLTKDYFTIYSINDQEAVTTMPHVSFNLVNPPLVIDYSITSLNITREEDIEYKILSTVFQEKLMINRSYDYDWFRIIVRDRDTGNVVAEDGWGETYSLDSPKKLTLYKSGNYRFEFSGEKVNVSLTMKVKKEGNVI